MNYKSKYIDELIEIRKNARQNKDWILSDKIRTYLNGKQVYIFDTEEGQIVYHRKNQTRNGLIDKIQQESRAKKLFDAWLYSINTSINHTKFSTSIVLLLTVLN